MFKVQGANLEPLNCEPDTLNVELLTRFVVARKKNKKITWGRALLVFTVIPLAVWFLALLLWFFWSDVVRLAAPAKDVTLPAAGSARNAERSNGRQLQPGKPARENIPEQDRRKLDDILKQR